MAVWTASASAATLYDNSSDGTAIYLTSGFYSDTANYVYTFYSPFTLSSPATITGITWWGYYYNPDNLTPGTLPRTGAKYSFDIQGTMALRRIRPPASWSRLRTVR